MVVNKYCSIYSHSQEVDQLPGYIQREAFIGRHKRRPSPSSRWNKLGSQLGGATSMEEMYFLEGE
jgi:hypothetical protein